VRSALFVDIGSTTTDLVPIVTGSVAARGYTDAERLAAGELVYTGMVRSFAMAVAERAPFAGRWSPLINENFATMADVHRILGQLPDGVDQMATPDGRAKSIEASRARLARMIGCDMDDASETAWSMLARWFAEGQIRAIIDGAMLLLSYGRVPASAPIVGAGIGNIVVREVARRLERKHVAFDSIINVAPHARDQASHCAPAAALACLASPS
jgi:probable H4MPT-linked C1 transfer pathway protein